jgi:hypothetical protein
MDMNDPGKQFERMSNDGVGECGSGPGPKNAGANKSSHVRESAAKAAYRGMILKLSAGIVKHGERDGSAEVYPFGFSVAMSFAPGFTSGDAN